MAKTLLLAEKDEATWLASVAEFLGAPLPDSYRTFAIAHREEGFSAAYTAYMVKFAQDKIKERCDDIVEPRK